MALTNDQITAQNFKEFYGQIRPYLNGAAHSGFTPVGVVISVMGKTAPLNYLVCDGTVYNIADYPELAAYFARQFDGASNFFGGDGTTTFAVPDLRGEFLRGSGTNSHTNQGSGANVGEHQDGTQHISISTSSDTVFGYSGSGEMTEQNKDSVIGTRNGRYTGTGNTSNNYTTYYTSRPTNTSILYCIAYKNIFVDEGCNYSTDERVIGTWINGKPLYQKTVQNVFTLKHKDYVTYSLGTDCIIIDYDGYIKKDNMPHILLKFGGYEGNAMNVLVNHSTLGGKGGIAVYIDNSSLALPVDITFKYIKTTD